MRRRREEGQKTNHTSCTRVHQNNFSYYCKFFRLSCVPRTTPQYYNMCTYLYILWLLCVYRETFYYNILLRASEPLSRRVCVRRVEIILGTNIIILLQTYIVYRITVQLYIVRCSAGNDALLNFELDIGQRRLRRVCCIRIKSCSTHTHARTHTLFMHATVHIIRSCSCHSKTSKI